MSQVGLALFHALNKMKFAPDPRQGSGSGSTAGEAHSGRKTMIPSLLNIDRADSGEDAFDEADVTAGESTDDKEGVTEDPELVSTEVYTS